MKINNKIIFKRIPKVGDSFTIKDYGKVYINKVFNIKGGYRVWYSELPPRKFNKIISNSYWTSPYSDFKQRVIRSNLS